MGQPWFIQLAGAFVCVEATAMAVGGLFVASGYPLAGEFEWLAVPLTVITLSVGVGMLILEHQALNRRNPRCAMAMAAINSLLSLLFLVFFVIVAREGAFSLVLAVLALIAAFSAMAHFQWALRLPQRPSRRWRV